MAREYTVPLLLLGTIAIVPGAILLLRGVFTDRKEPYYRRNHHRKKGRLAIGGILLGVGIELIAIGTILLVAR